MCACGSRPSWTADEGAEHSTPRDAGGQGASRDGPGQSVRPMSRALRAARQSQRILIVSQATVDGVAVCVRELARAAAEQGYELTVACPAGGDLAAWAKDAN